MTEKHYKVRVEGDHIKKLASAKPFQAVAELIWNAADADATRIDLEVDADDIAMRSVTVRDNGHGIPHLDVEGCLRKAWRVLEGAREALQDEGENPARQGGKGRFKALALGRVADWTVR